MKRQPPSPTPLSELRLLLVEDNPLFVEQICGAMDRQPHKWSVHLVNEGRRALMLLSQPGQQFDLALVDIGLPDISGIEVIKACRQLFPDMPIVVISVMAAEPVVLSAIEAGANGYILKDESEQDITKGITQVMQGIYPLSPSLARYLFKQLAGNVDRHTGPDNTSFQLAPREVETLRSLSQGLTYEGVAERMGVTLSTVQSNVRNLYRKLNVRSQMQAVSKARHHDLI
jgi:DNA-binding NarL/FixJ family response regulator